MQSDYTGTLQLRSVGRSGLSHDMLHSIIIIWSTNRLVNLETDNMS